MKDNFQPCLDFVFSEEGGFQNDPNDRGNRLPDGRKGCTNMGITQLAWEQYVGRKVTTDEMKAITKDDAAKFYQEKYWQPIKGDTLPVGVDCALFDCAVNMGVGRAVRLLQRSLGVSEDGIIGPQTMQAVEDMNPRTLITDFCDTRSAFYQQLPDFSRYGKTWTRRVANVEKAAFNMAS